MAWSRQWGTLQSCAVLCALAVSYFLINVFVFGHGISPPAHLVLQSQHVGALRVPPWDASDAGVGAATTRADFKAAFVFLLGGTEQDSLDWLQCLASLEKYAAPIMASYPILVFYEPFMAENVTLLQRASAGSPFGVVFVEHTLVPPPHIPSSAPCPHSRRTPWGYCNMIQFFAMDIFALPVVRALDYYLRLDSDSIILGPVSEDLFALMARGGYTYAYNEERYDYLFVTVGLWRSTLEFMTSQNITPAWRRMMDILPAPEALDTSMVPMYYNNFEIVDVGAYLSLPRLAAWNEWINSSCGIYNHRWGDAPLRWLTVHLFVDPGRVLYVNEGYLRYKHGLGSGIPFSLSPD